MLPHCRPETNHKNSVLEDSLAVRWEEYLQSKGSGTHTEFGALIPAELSSLASILWDQEMSISSVMPHDTVSVYLSILLRVSILLSRHPSDFSNMFLYPFILFLCLASPSMLFICLAYAIYLPTTTTNEAVYPSLLYLHRSLSPMYSLLC